ncbi:flagellar biosynthesis protein FlaG [Photobacterium ganghwense]|uniref:flagellar protein FlaG n=1 Tax=Photobacterium ganghwense TaxID=320778 RepID=UPI00069DD547|nr:flagellar protein FlaG [Photobacterium ganghwense]PSU11275.1 flagellar biosynthesis protein FlaG [Photobacterium ganghwense]QSV13393.1 flagellar protein FlaG [Photobacterium ganghwense]
MEISPDKTSTLVANLFSARQGDKPATASPDGNVLPFQGVNSTPNAASNLVSTNAPQLIPSVEGPTSSEKAQPKYPTEEQQRLLENLMGRMNRSLRFELDEESGEQVVFIIDKQSGDVVRQIPAQDLLELNSNLAKYAPRSLSQQV